MSEKPPWNMAGSRVTVFSFVPVFNNLRDDKKYNDNNNNNNEFEAAVKAAAS